MEKLLLTIEDKESTSTELGTYYDVKSLVICAEGDKLFLWHHNEPVALKNGDTILHQEQRFKVHFIVERQQEENTQNLNWLSPLQTDVRNQHALLPQSNSSLTNSLTEALDPLSFLSPVNQAPDIFAPLPAARQSQPPMQSVPLQNGHSKPKLLSRLKETGKKLWQSTTPGTNQW